MPGLKYRRKGSTTAVPVVLMLNHENSKRVCIRSQILGNLKIIKPLFASSTKQIFLADYIKNWLSLSFPLSSSPSMEDKRSSGELM